MAVVTSGRPPAEPVPGRAIQAPGGRHGPEWLSSLWAAARTTRGAIGLTLVTLIVGVAIIGPWVAPSSPNALQTLPYAKPGGHFPLGADFLGRDVLSRVLNGGWVLLLMAAAATALGVLLGAAAGVSAAYLRGARDSIIMRTIDVILSFPQLVFALLLLSVIGPKLWLIVLAVAVSHAPQVGRVLRSATLDISEQDYVKAVELQGTRPAKVMLREIMPNLISPLMVEVGLRLTYSIVIIAGLAFLGFGQQPPASNWGSMINENRLGLALNPWAVIVPALLIALLTIGMNTFTDAVARVAIGVERPPEEAALLDELGPREIA
jgi:peptide/nickel transport system permease protein